MKKILLLLAVAACAPSPWSLDGFMHPDNGGAKRASFELGCAESQLHIVELGSGTIGVSGCEKKAVYKWVYGAGWVNNTGIEERKQAER